MADEDYEWDEGGVEDCPFYISLLPAMTVDGVRAGRTNAYMNISL